MERITKAMFAPVVLLTIAISGTASGQDKPTGNMPPKVLVVTREYTKPGKAGTLHEKTETHLFTPWQRPNGQPITFGNSVQFPPP
jgi:hypothetical protein